MQTNSKEKYFVVIKHYKKWSNGKEVKKIGVYLTVDEIEKYLQDPLNRNWVADKKVVEGSEVHKEEFDSKKQLGIVIIEQREYPFDINLYFYSDQVPKQEYFRNLCKRNWFKNKITKDSHERELWEDAAIHYADEIKKLQVKMEEAVNKVREFEFYIDNSKQALTDLRTNI